MSINSPLQTQQPAPSFANGSGFWTNNEAQNNEIGLSSILPQGTFIQADVAIKSRLLLAQINWTPAKGRWENTDLQVSVSDAQFFLALESGGDTQQGRLTVIVGKFQFNRGFPKYNDTFKIQSAGKWHQFVITEIIGQFDDNEPALALYLEINQDDLGD